MKPRDNGVTIAALLGGSAMALMLPNAAAARAQTAEKGTADAEPAGVTERLLELEEQLKAQQALLEAQSRLIAEQRSEIDALKLQVSEDEALVTLRGRGYAQSGAAPLSQQTQDPQPQVPDEPVGEAPTEPEPNLAEQVRAVPQDVGVLTPAGTFVFDPSFDYIRSSANRLVFRGFELIPGIQIGVIEATDADRDTLMETFSLRYGLTSRLEIEGRIPLMYRSDRIEVVQQRDEGIVRSIELQERNIGDIEFSLRYQLNSPKGPQDPIYVASLRVKTPSGKGPFDVGFDEFGVATGLATGSGFWGVEPGINFLLPSAPVVIYAAASYLYHVPEDVNRVVGGAFIGHVDPGDAISASLGFGFALNPRFSFSLGYRHNYIFPTEQEIGGTDQRSNELQVGVLNFGMSYRLSEVQTVNFQFDFGVTSDAPDMRVTIRFPFSF
ncbi:transporter [Sphingomonas sp. LaA6.9]|uniref:transporter n=1 Tax=Sphingomonas sp. LaA6.9 TaxID=2919914 RepID=UPI001F502516|nr:transporter [Sphingomonas sp. LaA6.9]MCJ8158053.1 hypothetical protein [Sphingomonas sp. LaA6.9]